MFLLLVPHFSVFHCLGMWISTIYTCAGILVCVCVCAITRGKICQRLGCLISYRSRIQSFCSCPTAPSAVDRVNSVKTCLYSEEEFLLLSPSSQLNTSLSPIISPATTASALFFTSLHLCLFPSALCSFSLL